MDMDSSNLVIVDLKQLGKSIRQKRKKLGINIIDAALMMGISKNTLSKLENGDAGVSLGKLFLVTHELGIKLFVLE